MDINEKMLEIIGELGIYVSEDANDERINMDSFQFISLIVRIEETFSITVGDEYLVKDRLTTFSEFCEMIKNYVNPIPQAK